MDETEVELRNRVTLPRVFQIVSTVLPQRDVVTLLLVSPWCCRTLASDASLWQVLDLHEMNKAGERLTAALALSRYHHVKQINLEFAQDVEDKHLSLLTSKCMESLQDLEALNLNGCQKISDHGIAAVTIACPNLKSFSIYWNVRVTDLAIKHLVNNCRKITNLNLSGCKGISDQSLHLLSDNYKELETLNLTRCIKLTDDGLQQITLKCSSLQSLNLYALPSFTENSYRKISLLPNLRFLDLCGSQNLSDEGLTSIAKCRKLVSLNLTWCVRVTDIGVIAVAQSCTSLELLSLFGIIGVTDKCLEVLSTFCSSTLTTLDVNGCTGIKRRSRQKLLQLFPNLNCFKVHS
ncbi:F-box protein At3g58530 isoform X1 [Aristolochia californica]|uniref:F-box protein At3g58530 isoform X1 n=2 Tax=Aristolochia californica TaxID=171875 RepID=UPI0035D6BF09